MTAAPIAGEVQSLRDIVRDAGLLQLRREEINALRTRDMREWALNIEFYRGNQYAFWNKFAPGGGRVESLPVEDGDKPRYKVRLVLNQIMPGVNNYVAQLTKTRPVITAEPDSGADRDVKAAETAEMLFEHWWREQSLDAKQISALVLAQLSQGYWLIDFDKYAGKPMSFMLNPQTKQPILDEDVADAFKDELQAAGVDPKQYTKTVYAGDVRVRVFSGDDVWLDPATTNFEDAQYCIVREMLTPDEIQARFNVKVSPDSTITPSGAELTLMYRRDGAQQVRPKNVRAVYHGYFRPGPVLARGRYVCWIEGPNKIIAQSDWNLPFTDLPLVKFPGIERPNSPVDEARVTHARPIQKDLNRLVSQINEHKNLTIKPQMVAPVGSLRQRLTSEPGAVFEYNPVAGLQPEWRPTPNLPAYVFEYLAQLRGELDRTFNRIPTERDQLPARIDAGHAITSIQEAVADQLSNEIRRLELALARAGSMLVQLAKAYYTEPRIIKILGPGGSVRARKFLGSDLEGGFSFHAAAMSGLPQTHEGKRQEILQLMQMGLIDQLDAMRHLELANMSGVRARMAVDEDMAYREHDKLLRGEPINQQEMLQTMQQIQQTGVNPETGQPFQDPNEVQGALQKAAMAPLPYENSQVHLDIHGQYMKSSEFEALDPQIQANFVQHFMATWERLLSIPQNIEPVKTTLSLSGTVGPTVAADILQHHGIFQATPETMQEPPLDTRVYDILNQPLSSGSGNTQLSPEQEQLAQAQQVAAIQQAQAKHDVGQAKAQQMAGQGQDAHEMQLLQQLQQMEQAEDSHQQQQASAAQQMAHAEELHQERLRQMRKPKPSSGGKK